MMSKSRNLMLQEDDSLELRDWIVDLHSVMQCAEGYQCVGIAGDVRDSKGEARPPERKPGATMGHGYVQMLDVDANLRSAIELNCNSARARMTFPNYCCPSPAIHH